MNKSVKASESSIECNKGELYELTFPQDINIENCFRFFSHDVGSQTEESDVIYINTLTEALSTLTKDNSHLHRELNLIKSTLHSEFHRRLTNSSNLLYRRINERLNDLERSQKDRVEVVRRAFRSQLSDALSHMSSLYNEKLSNKLLKNRTVLESEESSKYTKKVADLTLKLKKSEAKIKDLLKQIAEYQELDSQQTVLLESESESEHFENLEIELNEEIIEEEISKDKELINEFSQKIQELEKQNQADQKNIEYLHLTNININAELLSMNRHAEILKAEKQILITKINNLEESCHKKHLEIQALYNSQQSKPVTPKEITNEKPVLATFELQKNFIEFPDLSKEVISLKNLIQTFQNKEYEEKKEFNKLKNSLVLENKCYNEEIKVLQSIHLKLKEEMFNRFEMQNNFKALHSASVAYAKNKQPMGIFPNQYMELTDSKSMNNINTSTFKNQLQLLEKDNELLSNFLELSN